MHRRRINFLLRSALVIAFHVQPRLSEAASVHGRWVTPGYGAVVELYSCTRRADRLCGRILWLQDETNARDHRNPAPERRGRSLIGVEMLTGFQLEGDGTWRDGEIYNPGDGRTYSGTITMNGDRLELEGCALRVFCQRQIWRRPDFFPSASGRVAP